MNGDDDKPFVSSKDGESFLDDAWEVAADRYEKKLSHDEDIKLRQQNRELTKKAVYAAMGINLAILITAGSLLFCGCGKEATCSCGKEYAWTSAWGFSVAVVSFVVLYGVIIKSLSSSNQKDDKLIDKLSDKLSDKLGDKLKSLFNK